MSKPELTVTIKDCIVKTCRATGPGGQNVNKRETAVRIEHKPSGAIAECKETRDQLENKRRAFKKLVLSPEFKIWVNKVLMIEAFGKEVNDERIRTYNFTRNTVIDHRIPGVIFSLDKVLNGELPEGYNQK